MKQLKQLRRGAQAAFSLAELMVVIVIIGLLATLVVPAVVSKLFKASVGIAVADITTIGNGVNEYMIDHNGRAPDSLEDLITEDEYGSKILDRDTIPTDPWGNEYIYIPGSSSGSSDWTVMTYGQDGLEGGEGKDRDITYDMIKNKEL